jgi:predicted ATPase
MKLISKVSVNHFRSIKDAEISGMGEFTALAGLNNSGKSNVLRALNAFFTGNTDANTPIVHAGDYYRFDLKSKKKLKNISVTVHFDLPDSFKFRKGLEPVSAKLGKSFSLCKSWRRDSIGPEYFLNNDVQPLPHEERAKIDQFLGLISFRYIPNRVMPLEIVRAEHRALRDVLVRRLATKANGQSDMFDSIKETSDTLIRSLQNSMATACPGVGGIRLDTPTSWQDLIFAFGYRLSTDGVEIEDHAQGSGIQSLLMLETLSLIDRDYFQKFGWRQAAVWAIEEPESSLHASLEAQVSSYLSELATDQSNRLQLIATTHSDLMLQNADRAVFVAMQSGTTTFETTDKREVLQKAAYLGISRYSHPVLAEPLRPLILVEGKYDYDFLTRAVELLCPHTKVRFAYLEVLEGGDSTGGDSALLNYLKANRNAIRFRLKQSPLIILPDWDSSGKVSSYKSVCNDDSIYRVMIWPDTSFNPKLGNQFKGIERHLSNRIIDEADKKAKVLGKTKDNSWTVNREDYNKKFKPAVNEVVRSGITLVDLIHVEAFIKLLVNAAEQVR